MGGKDQGRIQELVQGGLKLFFTGGGGAQHPLGTENPLCSIDFTGPRGAMPPLNTPERTKSFPKIRGTSPLKEN